ncbi:MAG: DUF1592 domain-containing protein [Myxococcota bacterium]
MACLLTACGSEVTSRLEPDFELEGSLPGAGSDTQPLCTDHDPSTIADVAVARRMSVPEIDRTARDLFGELGVGTDVPELALSAPSTRYTFSTYAEANSVSQFEADTLLTWAEDVSEVATADLDGLLGCTAGTVADTCVRSFAEQLAGLAYRRPPTLEEIDELAAVYEALTLYETPQVGIRAMVELALLSPHFMYHSVETRTGSSGQFAPFALASRLAYFLWGTMPDSALRQLAANDELQSPEQVRSAALSMLDDPRANSVLRQFHSELLHLSGPEALIRDPQRYPLFNGDVAVDMRQEFNAFIDDTVANNGGLEALLTNDSVFANSRLEALLGLEERAGGPDDWVRHSVPERSGLFGRPLFLTSADSLILRGVAVIEKLMCTHLDPPDDTFDEIAEQEAAENTGAVTELDAVAARAGNSECSVCHTAIDAFGLSMSGFDRVGAPRDTYPDGTAIIEASQFPTGEQFANSRELMMELSGRADVQECYTRKWIEWGVGHELGEQAGCEVARLTGVRGSSVKELIANIVSSGLIMNRAVESGDG